MSDDCSLLVMEQFHGPTCAFKDVALQFVGNMFEFFLARKARAVADPAAGIVCDPDTPSHITVVGATSGDTGSAAIEGLRGKANIECVLAPRHWVPPPPPPPLLRAPESPPPSHTPLASHTIHPRVATARHFAHVVLSQGVHPVSQGPRRCGPGGPNDLRSGRQRPQRVRGGHL